MHEDIAGHLARIMQMLTAQRRLSEREIWLLLLAVEELHALLLRYDSRK